MRAVWLAIVFTAHTAFACLCGPLDPDEAVHDRDYVFVGTVVRHIDLHEEYSMLIHRRTVIDVERVWKGRVLSYAVVTPSMGCWADLEIGDRLLFFTDEDLVVGRCNASNSMPSSASYAPISIVASITTFVSSTLAALMIARRRRRSNASA